MAIQRDLIPVNAIISFLKDDSEWPNPLKNAGYRLVGIEQTIGVGSLGIDVEADVIALCRRTDTGLVCEAKSGRTLSEQQLRGYAAITVEDVQRTANVTFSNPRTARIQSLYCCFGADAESICSQMKAFGVHLPVLALGAQARLISGKLLDSNLHNAFEAGVDLPPLEQVPLLLSANTQTSTARIATVVLRAVVGNLQRGRRAIGISKLMKAAFPDWEVMGISLRRHLRSEAHKILVDVSKNELRDYIRISRQSSNAELEIELEVSILKTDSATRTRNLQKLQRLAEAFITQTDVIGEDARGIQPRFPELDPNSDEVA